MCRNAHYVSAVRLLAAARRTRNGWCPVGPRTALAVNRFLRARQRQGYGDRSAEEFAARALDASAEPTERARPSPSVTVSEGPPLERQLDAVAFRRHPRKPPANATLDLVPLR